MTYNTVIKCQMHTNDVDAGGSATHHEREEEILEIKKGPWTEKEDSILENYIKNHGEGHWNFLAHSAGHFILAYNIYV